jgi:uncharacterized protein (DUF934 family)
MPKLIDKRGVSLTEVAITPDKVLVLNGGDDAELTQANLAALERIDIAFTHFTDGRGYSSAKLLRDRLKWQGEIRAVGDITVDQLGYLSRCGFSTFALRDDQDLEQAKHALLALSKAYQRTHPIVVGL